MSAIRNFEESEAWKTARALAAQLHLLAGKGEFSKDWTLRNQISRAAVSVMSNIAEGLESDSDKVKLRFLGIAKASAAEIRSQLYVALDRCYIDDNEFSESHSSCDRVARQLGKLMKYLRKCTQ